VTDCLPGVAERLSGVLHASGGHRLTARKCNTQND